MKIAAFIIISTIIFVVYCFQNNVACVIKRFVIFRYKTQFTLIVLKSFMVSFGKLLFCLLLFDYYS